MIKSLFAALAVVALIFVFAGPAAACGEDSGCGWSFSAGTNYGQNQWANFKIQQDPGFSSYSGGVQHQRIWASGQDGSFDGKITQAQGLNQKFKIPGGKAYQFSESTLTTKLSFGDLDN
ncbi:MAG TPA: hypothetical protein ENH22_00410 [Candidatus Campbellbacteria bacterium]|nr:hypothetical protein [Candidatus Campbellbacteria bacterium]